MWKGEDYYMKPMVVERGSLLYETNGCGKGEDYYMKPMNVERGRFLYETNECGKGKITI